MKYYLCKFTFLREQVPHNCTESKFPIVLGYNIVIENIHCNMIEQTACTPILVFIPCTELIDNFR